MPYNGMSFRGRLGSGVMSSEYSTVLEACPCCHGHGAVRCSSKVHSIRVGCRAMAFSSAWAVFTAMHGSAHSEARCLLGGLCSAGDHEVLLWQLFKGLKEARWYEEEVAEGIVHAWLGVVYLRQI